LHSRPRSMSRCACCCRSASRQDSSQHRANTSYSAAALAQVWPRAAALVSERSALDSGSHRWRRRQRVPPTGEWAVAGLDSQTHSCPCAAQRPCLVEDREARCSCVFGGLRFRSRAVSIVNRAYRLRQHPVLLQRA
jgi:hypothetical protein